jgi:signal transduction histidine kinase
LLGFARKEQVRRSAVDVDAVIGGLTDLLDRTLGGGVIVETSTGSGSARACGDESQLENAILNLCVNARDAMPGGGRLTISTERIDLVANDARAVDLAMGGYVRMSVADTGSGIPPDVASRIFEPFFTTKAAGRGTGLGLSQVFAFARDSGGGVKVESAVGEGTTFHIYLPVWREGDGDDQAAALDRSGAAAHALAH